MKNKTNEINLFMPGRVCLLGEHSDWTFEFKNENPNLLPGYTIATAIDKGVYATIKKSKKFEFKMGENSFSCDMNEEPLEKESLSGSFYSYVAGTALYMLRTYQVGGINVEVKYNTLPIKKGLSSSAAICSLLVKAFDYFYDLNLDFATKMDCAYYGERLAQSKCGKLDQICINGEKLVKMTFHPDKIDIDPIKVKSPIYMVIADLNAAKDTKKILNALHECYPFADNEKEQKIQDMLGYKNKELIDNVVEAIEMDDKEKLGDLINKSQELIDESAIPICDEYKAPVLHSVMDNAFIKKLAYAVRGIGSGGDGSVQVIAKDAICQNLITNYFNTKLNMDAFSYTIRPYYKVRKAIIPLAGLGNRLYPLTRAFRHAFLPIHDGKTMKPLILKLVEELDRVGIDEICLVIGKNDFDAYNQFFKLSLNENYLNSLDEELITQEFNTLRLGEKITYVVQDKPLGLGHAIGLCKDFVGDDPVLVTVGDVYFKADNDVSVYEELLKQYEKEEANVTFVGPVQPENIKETGIVGGVFSDNVINVNKVVEKPTIEYAMENLSIDGTCYAQYGTWIFTNEAVQKLDYNIKTKTTTNGKYEITGILNSEASSNNLKAVSIKGKYYDLKTIEKYKDALFNFE